MRHRIPLALSCLLLLIAAPVQLHAQSERPSISLGDDLELRPHLQYRPRFIAQSGQDFAAGNNIDVFGHRARLGVEIVAFEWLSAMVVGQDVRIWGEEAHTLFDNSADGFDLQQAWIEARGPWGLRLRVGRQEHVLADARLIGNNNWLDQSRRYDGVLLALEQKHWQARLFWARVGDSDSATRDAEGNPLADVDLAYAWLHYAGWSWAKPSLTVIYDRQASRSQHRATLGAALHGRLPGTSYELELFTQRGRAQGRTLAAFFAHARVHVDLPIPGRLGVGVFLDYLSGDDPATNANESFDNLYGNGHKFYGFMDYFRNVPAQTKNNGLFDVGARITAAPLEGLQLLVDWHLFRLPEAVVETSGSYSQLGHELDFVATYRFNRYLKAQGGLGLYLPDDAMTCLLGACRPDAPAEGFAYFMLDFTI